MNRWCANFVLVPVWCVLLVPLQACGDDRAKLIGDWEAVSAEIGGRAIAEMNFAGMAYTFRGDSFELTAGRFTPAGIAKKTPLRGSYTLDDSKSPRHLTFLMDTSKEEYKYIYDIENDILTLCFTVAHEGVRGGVVRPNNFETKGTLHSVYKFKRVVRD